MFRQMLTRLGVPAVVAAVFLMAVLLMAYEIRSRWTENGRDITLPNGQKLFLGSQGTGAPYDEKKDDKK